MPKKFKPYSYSKAPVESSEPVALPPTPQPTKQKSLTRLIPPALITLGSLMIANVAWPILSYQLFTAPQIQKDELHSPIPKSQLGNIATIMPGESPVPTQNAPPQAMGADIDYSNPSTWFPQANYQQHVIDNQIDSYYISIPSLDIEDAHVIVGGDDLDEGLIQYPDTADPGQLGSPVIFGHSILRQFYNPDINNPRRYVSIFSKIMTLDSGDRIFVDYDGIKYTYEVKDKVEVQPDDLFILEQRYNNRELKLITCTPEGTYLRRGVIVAQLINLNNSDDKVEN